MKTDREGLGKDQAKKEVRAESQRRWGKNPNSLKWEGSRSTGREGS